MVDQVNIIIGDSLPNKKEFGLKSLRFTKLHSFTFKAINICLKFFTKDI